MIYTALLEFLFMCLPLAKDGFTEDFFYRIAGEPDPVYLIDKLEDFWRLIPDSPSKEYVEQYAYFHYTLPSIDNDPEFLTTKGKEYRAWRNSRAYAEQEMAYRQRVWAFRDKVIRH